MSHDKPRASTSAYTSPVLHSRRSSTTSIRPDTLDEKRDTVVTVNEIAVAPNGAQLGRERRPPRLEWGQGFKPFGRSLGARLSSIFTRRFITCILAGQALSLCITSTSVLTTELRNHGWALPTFQTFFLYSSLNIIFTPYTIWVYGIAEWSKMLLSYQGLCYLFFAIVDVEANFLVIRAYGYTDMLSCMLLDAWATPACMIFAYFLVQARYHWTQLVGVAICISGLALLVVSDFEHSKSTEAKNRVLGDILMLLGATGYGLSNALEELYVRRAPLYEVVGQLGWWGCIVNAIQSASLERNAIMAAPWDGRTAGLLVAYTASMLALAVGAPILFRLSSSPFYNLSILTSDFWGLLFGLVLFGYSPGWPYFVAFGLVIGGLFLYFSVAEQESQELDIKSRGKRAKREAREAAAQRGISLEGMTRDQ